MIEMAAQSLSISEITMQIKVTTNQLRRLSDLPEIRNAVTNGAIEAALKDISAQLQRNKKDMDKLLQELQECKNEIRKCKKRLDAMQVLECIGTGNEINKTNLEHTTTWLALSTKILPMVMTKYCLSEIIETRRSNTFLIAQWLIRH